MENGLDPKELARTKKAARTARISRIRRRVAVFGTSLVALFSGAAFIRSQIDQPQNPLPGATTTAAAAATEIPAGQTYPNEYVYGGSGDGQDSGDEQKSDDSEHGGIIQTATETLGNVFGGTQTPTSAPAQPAPAPAPVPLTTSQS